jgi:hypothetical protein
MRAHSPGAQVKVNEQLLSAAETVRLAVESERPSAIRTAAEAEPARAAAERKAWLERMAESLGDAA